MARAGATLAVVLVCLLHDVRSFSSPPTRADSVGRTASIAHAIAGFDNSNTGWPRAWFGGRKANDDSDSSNAWSFTRMRLNANNTEPARATLVEAASAEVQSVPPVEFVAECDLPTRFGQFRLRGYRQGREEPTVLVMGDVSGDDVMVRVHDQCFTSEVMGSMRCDCREQLDMSMQMVAEHGRGIIIYLQQEGRGIGLANKIAAYSLQDDGMDTVEANRELGFPDENRKYTMVPDILKDLSIQSVRLVTNNPFKVSSLEELGVTINARIPLVVVPKPTNLAYLRTKALRMAHILPDMGTEDVPEAASSQADEFFNPTTGKTHKWCMGRESVQQAIDAIGRGEPVCVTDDEDRENEGDLIMAAELATPETVGFFVRYTSGVLCVGMEGEELDALELPQMVPNNQDPKNTAFTLSVDAKEGVSTGISAGDRAHTLRLLAAEDSTASDFCRPGHIFPLRAREGGVLTRDGHTEASVDLCKLAGLRGAGVLCEIVTADSISMARMPELIEFSHEHELAMTTIEDLICYRLETEGSSA